MIKRRDGQRAEAKAQGLAYYFTGRPCTRGHVSKRITASGTCHQCHLDDKQKKRSSKLGYRTRSEITADTTRPLRKCTSCGDEYPATAEFFVALRKRQPGGTIWNGLARECRKCRNKRYLPYYAANREALIAAAIQHGRDNPVPKRNRAMLRYMRHKKSGGCPPWADQRQIETIYAIADFLTRKTGIPHEVDHHYPLIHPRCCGLHVPWNLCVMTRAKNQAKGNRLPEERVQLRVV